jgi:hypothetical protein
MDVDTEKEGVTYLGSRLPQIAQEGDCRLGRAYAIAPAPRSRLILPGSSRGSGPCAWASGREAGHKGPEATIRAGGQALGRGSGSRLASTVSPNSVGGIGRSPVAASRNAPQISRR